MVQEMVPLERVHSQVIQEMVLSQDGSFGEGSFPSYPGDGSFGEGSDLVHDENNESVPSRFNK